MSAPIGARITLAGNGGAARSASAFPASSCSTTGRAGRSWTTSANPFAVVIQAHLKTQETRRAPEERYRAKLALAKSLYRRGWGRDDILELFRFIDWMLRLPEELGRATLV